jgi:hAT family C-terminal dimerisation region
MQLALLQWPRRGRKPVQTPSSNALPVHIQDEYLPSSQQRRLASLQDDSQAYLRVSITNAWKKLNEYYIKLGESPLFAAAIILHPGLSLRWLEERWSDKEQLTWLYDAKQGLLGFWECWYQHNYNQEEDQQPRAQQQGPVVIQHRREDNKYQQWLHSITTKLSDNGSELDQYYRLNLPQQVNNPIQWWLSQQSSFPTLSKLALDLLAVPAMAADCEREFSLAKLTISSQRHSLQPDTIEKIQCLKNWLHRGAISIGDLEGS